MVRTVRVLLVIFAALSLSSCESPTDPDEDETISVDDFVESTTNPDPAIADGPTGKIYRVVLGNNQPDEFREYDWKTSFGVTIRINANVEDDDLELEFPFKLNSATVKVEQAAGGIISPPTGGEIERFESTIVSATSNQIHAVNGAITVNFDVWYDLPNLRREALLTVSLNLQDNDGRTLTKTVKLQVAP
jgi:hypothetical protein